MIKVLVIVPTNFGYDGISNVVTNYYLYQNHEVVKMDLLTINPVNRKLEKIIEENGDHFYVVPFRNKRPLKYVVTLTRLIKKNKYQIIHAHGCSSTLFVEMLAAKLAGVKVRISHSHNTTCDHKKLNRLLRPFFEKLYTHGFACSQEAGEWLFQNDKFEVISNGIDYEKFGFRESIRMEFRHKYKLDDMFVVGHVGRFSKQKNHIKLIEIFESFSKTHSNTKLVLIGDGELRLQIEDKVKEKGLDVLFVGLSDEVECWLQAMDIMIFPSLFEGLPLGIIEAQAAGLLCLLSDTISPMVAITDHVKFVSLTASSQEWADEVNKLEYKDRILQKTLIQQKIQDAHFNIRNNCRELEEMYANLLL